MNIVRVYTFLLRHPEIAKEWKSTKNSKSLILPKKEKSFPEKVPEFSVYKQDAIGLQYISGENSRNALFSAGYIQFHTSSSTARRIINQGLPLYTYASGAYCEGYFFSILRLQELLAQFADSIYGIDSPVYKLPASFIPFYLETIKCYQKMKESVHWFYHEDSRNVFLYKDLYRQVEWSREMVEVYAENLYWKALIEDSSFIVTEDLLSKYYDHLPLTPYLTASNRDRFVNRFDGIESISFDFIKEHIKDLDLRELFHSGNFSLSSQELRFLCEYWEKNYQSSSLYYLCSNNNFDWTTELLIEIARLYPQNCWKEFLKWPDDRRLSIYHLIKTIPNYESIIHNMSDNAFFIHKLKDGIYSPKDLRLKFNAYSDFFTIDNIKANIGIWNEVLGDEFLGTHRECTDHWYYIQQVSTMWNLFKNNRQLRINYEIVQFLAEKTIIEGGQYKKEYQNQDYPDYGFYTRETNALDYYIKTSFHSLEDVKRVCENESLVSRFLTGGNQDIIEYVCNSIFEDNDFEEFLSMANHLSE